MQPKDDDYISIGALIEVVTFSRPGHEKVRLYLLAAYTSTSIYLVNIETGLKWRSYPIEGLNDCDGATWKAIKDFVDKGTPSVTSVRFAGYMQDYMETLEDRLDFNFYPLNA